MEPPTVEYLCGLLTTVPPAQRSTAYWVMDAAMFNALVEAYGPRPDPSDECWRCWPARIPAPVREPSRLLGRPIRIEAGATLGLVHHPNVISGVY